MCCRAQFQDVLVQAELGLTQEEISSLMDYFDTDGNGSITLDEFLVGAYDVLAHLARESAILEAQNLFEGMDP